MNELLQNTRLPAWDQVGLSVTGARTSTEVLQKSCLAWNVAQASVQWLDMNGTLQVDDSFKCNYRDDNGRLLGVVGRDYTVVQNADAFAFVDYLISEGVRYEKVGCLHGGKKVWLLAKMPEHKILHDTYSPYLLISNGHDGKTSVNVAVTPVRMACWNTLNVALRQAKQRWSFRHTLNVMSQFSLAVKILTLAQTYMEELEARSEKLATIKLSASDVENYIDRLFPDKETDIAKRNNEERIARFRNCYAVADLDNVRGTAYGFLMAVSDYTSHKSVLTQRQRECHFRRTVLEPAPMLELASSFFAA
jgi:phage/plasmid-like protein (TIGR03299 family)